MANPRYPVYIISKGRWESRLTSKALEAIGVPYHIVIEPQEYPEYAAVIDPKRILTLPFSDLGQGSIPARNWVWEHALTGGSDRHWILDDNLRWFARVHRNKITKVDSGICFRVTEDFVDRYENVAMAGLNYEMFIPAHQKKRYPFTPNTRIYSCILLRNDLPFRWRGRYNEDTDLSLRILKAGYCTVLMNAFVCKKIATMRMKGGNTDVLYRQNDQVDGRLLMAQSLRDQHPDIVTIKRKWGRWQHQVDYSQFRMNQLRLRADAIIPDGPDEYGMKLVRRVPQMG